MQPKRLTLCDELVEAVLDGTKDVTRRLDDKPRYAVGDTICIAETHRFQTRDMAGYHIEYMADGLVLAHKMPSDWKGAKPRMDPWRNGKKLWRTARFMPVWASRDWRGRIIDVRKERLQEITEEEAVREGCDPFYWMRDEDAETWDTAKEVFDCLWDRLHANHHGCLFADNPRVIRYEWEPVHAD